MQREASAQAAAASEVSVEAAGTMAQTTRLHPIPLGIPSQHPLITPIVLLTLSLAVKGPDKDGSRASGAEQQQEQQPGTPLVGQAVVVQTQLVTMTLRNLDHQAGSDARESQIMVSVHGHQATEAVGRRCSAVVEGLVVVSRAAVDRILPGSAGLGGGRVAYLSV